MKIYKMILIAFGVLAFMTTPAFSVEYFLRADVTTTTVPDVNGNPINIPMWGFALENSAFTAGTTATVPGPMLTVPSGDTTLTIHLKNNLTAANLGLSMGCPVSLVIPGQIAPMTPVRFGPAPYPQYEGRIRSLTHETPPDNSTVVDYVWNNVQPGSYVYHSGTHVQCHVQMGLYGGVIKDYALAPYKQVYQNIVYDVNVPLFFSEIDPVFHMTVDANMYGPGKAMSSTIDYEPKYFLINGQVFDSNNPVSPIPAGASGGGTLLRLFNMGLQSRSVLLQGSYVSLVAEDGQPYKYPKEQYAVLLPAGKTIDAMVSFPAAGTYPVYDRKLGLVNDRLTGGGMLKYLSVAAGNMWPIINSVTATPASITDSQTSQLQVTASDTDGPSALTYSWDIPVVAGSLDSTTIANPVFTPAFIVGTQTYTFTVTVSDGLHVDIGTVDVTVTGVPNAAPIINSVTATPASILDTQTSQLQVNATDDGLPSPPAALSYNWIVPAGAGSVSNAAIANPIYTPPDVVSTQIYTLTVEVSDGAFTVSSTVDVTVNDTIVVPVVYEAEDALYSRIGVIDSTAVPGYTGTGFADYTSASGSWIQWTVNVASAGQYELIFRYGLASGNRPLRVTVNGTIIVASQSFPATGAWSNWQTVTVIATLNAGSNTIRTTTIGSSGPNMDNLELFYVVSGNNAPVITSITATSASILDTQTSQLQVNATDDGLPSSPAALSYNWIVPAGAGSVSNSAIANPVYTPPDVALTQIYTLTVEVSDGLATVSNTVNVTVNDTIASPVIYEAESAVLSGAVVSTVIPGYTGTGFVDYTTASGQYIEWTVNAPAAGSYNLEFRYGLAAGNRPLSINVNGGAVEVPSLAFPATGAWSNWQTVTTTQTLNAGPNTIRATAIGSSGANIDHLVVVGN